MSWTRWLGFDRLCFIYLATYTVLDRFNPSSEWLQTKYLLDTLFGEVAPSHRERILEHVLKNEGEWIMFFEDIDTRHFKSLRSLLRDGFDLDELQLGENVFELDSGLELATTDRLRDSYYNAKCYQSEVEQTMAVRDGLPPEADAHGCVCADCSFCVADMADVADVADAAGEASDSHNSTNVVVFCGDVANPPRNLCLRCLNSEKLLLTKVKFMMRHPEACSLFCVGCFIVRRLIYCVSALRLFFGQPHCWIPHPTSCQANKWDAHWGIFLQCSTASRRGHRILGWPNVPRAFEVARP